ncbi:MAG: hypothetical protein AAFY98_06705 [Verrucomicrobiota bacterium]
MRANSGLSRLELTIASALVLLVILIAVPILLSGQSSKKKQTSANNLLQWGIALNLYLIDNNNRLPTPGTERVSSDEITAWYNTLPLYLSRDALSDLSPGPLPEKKEESIWINPAALDSAEKLPRGYFTFYYGMNEELVGAKNKPLRIYDVSNPTKTVFLSETCQTEPGIDPSGVEYFFGKPKPSPEATAHVLFCDGHVELVPYAELNFPHPEGIQWKPSQD